MSITKKKVLKTVLLPEFLPRIRDLFSSGFGFLSYIIVLVYNTVRIIPDNHSYLKAENIGKYTVREAIATAADHIKLEKKNIDQIIIFFSVIAALFILLIQFILLIVAMLIPKASAASMPEKVEDFFTTPNPQEDIAFRMLDLVFGLENIFNSKEIANKTALHDALHKLFEFYSFGIILVGALIIVYFVVAIASETAVSGTPFGKRFNKTWAPVRVILFFGLLIPLSSGINGGQYITLMTAKLGSGLASSGWIYFNKEIESANETLTGKKEQNVAHIKYSSLSHLPGFMMVVRTCKKGYDLHYDTGGDGDGSWWPDRWNPEGDQTGVRAWAVYRVPKGADTIDESKDESDTSEGGGEKKNKDFIYQSEPFEESSYQDLTEKSKGNFIHVVFGVKDEEEYSMHRGGVAPICGTVAFKETDIYEPGSAVIQTAYYDLVKEMWQGTREIDKYAESYLKHNVNIDPDPESPLPDKEYINRWLEHLKNYMGNEESGVIKKAIDEQVEKGKWQMTQEMKDYGWAGAAIWYNKIAQQNGALVTAIHQTPAAVVYPRVMEIIAASRRKSDKLVSRETLYTPHYSAGGANPDLAFPGEIEIARALNEVYKFWEGARVKTDQQLTGNVFVDTINTIFGTYGLFEICKNTDIHPLAQLAALGKSMLDKAIASFMSSVGVGVYSILLPFVGEALSAASKFFISIAMIGFMAGFILFYVLPFFPFIYFFFAVGGWVKGIFEAMVAIPLWALAHLRIDGEGVPGDAAIRGYFLIFEIFIRPILIIFGLLAAISIFAAMVKILNEIFYLVIANVSGSDPKASETCFKDPSSGGEELAKQSLSDVYRGPLDEFFFTVVYTVIVYMIGISAFKLIDAIPNKVLRWMGEEIETFNDTRDDSAQGLMKYVTLAGSRFGDKLAGSFGGLGDGARQSVTRMFGRNQ